MADSGKIRQLREKITMAVEKFQVCDLIIIIISSTSPSWTHFAGPFQYQDERSSPGSESNATKSINADRQP